MAPVQNHGLRHGSRATRTTAAAGPWLVPCVAALLLAGWLLGGCAATPAFEIPDRSALSEAGHVPGVEPADQRDFTPVIFDGRGRPASWDDVRAGLDWADVIMLGERHGDGTGHRVQHAVVEDVLVRRPGAAVAMEMFTRDEQVIVDDYLAGLIDVEELTERANVGGWPGWMDNYQPTVDLAREHDADLIAANAPRRYVRLARLEGYDRLRELSAAQRATFDIPERLDDGPYFDRFREVMGAGGHGEMDDDHVRSVFRSQQLWDATMAGSIDASLRRGAAAVVHLNGGFHSDFEGGTVTQLRRLQPRARILTISLVPEDARSFRDEDRDRADFVIYTGSLPADSLSESDDLSDDKPDTGNEAP